jgi:hypothetical protein
MYYFTAYSLPKLVQIVASGKVVAAPVWVADEMIEAGTAKAAMIRVIRSDAPSWAQVINPGVVVVDTVDLVSYFR